MKIVEEIELRHFDFWGGAEDNASQLTCEELDLVEQILEDTFVDDMMTETEINDYFWFNFATICEWLDLKLDDNGDVIREVF